MKIRNFAFVVALLLTVTFSSCDSENEVINGGDDIVTRVSFSIAIPKGEPVTYALDNIPTHELVLPPAVHDADEYGIESLWLYEYDAAGKLLSAPVDIKNKLTGTGPTYNYEKNIIDKDKGSRRFIFVANEGVPSGITVGTTLATLKSKLATKILAGDASSKSLLNDFSGKLRIPMTGVAVQSGGEIIAVTGAAASVSVEMTRIVARIDINNQVPNLVITSVRLARANSHSYLFLNGDYEVPSVNTRVSGITPFVNLPTPFKFNTKMEKAFYLYEGHASGPKQEAVQIQVTGTLGTVPVFYSIPFWKGVAEVVVKRNHIYRLTLGDGATTVEPNTTVGFSIEDTPWNEVTMNETFNIIAATHSGAGTWDANTRTVAVDNAARSIVFDLTTQFVGHTAFTATIANAPAWITANITGSKLAINVQANNMPNAEMREAVIEVVSNVDATTKYSIKVQQAK